MYVIMTSFNSFWYACLWRFLTISLQNCVCSTGLAFIGQLFNERSYVYVPSELFPISYKILGVLWKGSLKLMDILLINYWCI